MKKETKVLLVKIAVGVVTTIAVSAVVTAAVKNIVPTDNLSTGNKVLYKFGTMVISGVAANAGSDYMGAIVNSLFWQAKGP